MDKVRFETSGALGLITLANPPLNLFDQELIEDLQSAVGQARQRPLRALLVRADGKNFSGGADVGIFKKNTAAEARERFTSHLRTIADLEECRSTIAAVQGVAWRPDWNSHWHAISYGRVLRPASGRSRRRLERPRCSAAFNVWLSGRDRLGRARSSTRPTSTTRRRSSDGTS